MDSYDFATHGIAYGATESEVDAILGNATETSARIKMDRPGFRDYATEKHYYTVYQPEYFDSFVNKNIPIITERFFVFFDESDRAFALERWLFLRLDAKRTGSTTWDLRTNKLMETDL